LIQAVWYFGSPALTVLPESAQRKVGEKMIDERIRSIIIELKNWFAKAKETFPKPLSEPKPVVDAKCQCELRDILAKLEPVIARLKIDRQDRLYQRLQDTLKRQEAFQYVISGTEEPDNHFTGLHNDLIDILEQCSDYFNPVRQPELQSVSPKTETPESYSDNLNLSDRICQEWCKQVEHQFRQSETQTKPAGMLLQFNTPTKNKKLPPAEQKAYVIYKYAISKKPELEEATDNEVYDWLENNHPEEYRLPSCETWKRQLRCARRYYGTQKNSLRAGRIGHSIIQSEQLQSLSEISSQFDKTD
jgi:hypothetical protein